jgi:phosphoenolpyruvate---glycerone phosphotransferase subunit DhaL
VSADLRSLVLAAADAVDGARAELGRLDGAAGDGDHGMTMSIAARNVRRALASLPDDASPNEILARTSAAVAGVGGAIGPLYGAALAAMAAEAAEADAAATAGLVVVGTDVTRLRRLAEAAEGAITGLGHAAPGDKTVVDALHPVVEALRRAETSGTDASTAITAAAEAAEAGAAATAGLVANVGRASRLGERSRGLPDAGATSLTIIVRALADAHRAASSGGGQ